MRAATEAIGARWDVVLRADTADRESRDWRNLRRVADRAAAAVEAAITADSRLPGKRAGVTVVIVYVR